MNKELVPIQTMKTNALSRRQALQKMAVGALALASAPPLGVGAGASVSWRQLPRWHGFNLQEKFMYKPDDLSRIAPEWSFYNEPFREEDFAMIAELGFDFVRLPMSYKCWTAADDWRQLRETPLQEIDQAVEWGRQYKIHVNLNFHRAPGYCINPPNEPLSLWDSDQALEACAYHWNLFAKRYRGIPSERLSFDLVNEPVAAKEKYVKVVTRLASAIREGDPDRLIIADGLNGGTTPVPELIALKIAQSTRGYAPAPVTHFRATWGGDRDGRWPTPTWPLKEADGKILDRQWLSSASIKPWKDLEQQGSGVHVGEWGVYNRTPHAVALAWMKDCLQLWREAGWGWALWCFRGSFGILDSGRADVEYENFKGHKLDRRMLELLKEFAAA